MDSGSSASEDGEREFKVVILGDGAVGKTSLIKRYCESDFAQNYKQTIGLDFYSKKVELPDGGRVTLRIWDIGGQQIGGSMIENYIHEADAVCFVYDVTNPDSFKDVEDWHRCVLTSLEKEKETPRSSSPLMVLVGNKTDLPNRQVTNGMHERAASMNHMEAFLISARSGERINALFTKIAARLCGVSVSQQELEMRDCVVANVESRPEERVSVFHATQEERKGRKEKDDCSVM
ncbi:putative small GTP-binding protein Rab28 [Trypanosoma theileri]|uniref:Putative small GTP-binding protein Rab28 n=1 Tax=Trypanosoma theileri TaxID=67003 RepID=A0A1X0P1V3_9TRYP|nr:putative small GTP-binding protein Rab28 [Trypanosoma theileri]ORC90907.1 putative small GTP-binding protein Rab28 [Trypanosoma theileri]